MALTGTSRKTDPGLQSLITELRRTATTNQAPIWKDVATRLSKPSRTWATVNVGKVAKIAGKDLAVVAGNVLAVGDLAGPVNVAAYRFSQGARDKIAAAKGKALTIAEAAKAHPKGSGVRIVA